MSGTDELFPDATQHPGIDMAAPTAADAPARSRRLGVVAWAIGSLAFVANVGGIATAIAVVLAVSQNLGDPAATPDVGWVIPYERAVIVGGFVLGIAAMILGVIAARQHRGRGFGILGAIVGGLAVATDLVVIALLASVITGVIEG